MEMTPERWRYTSRYLVDVFGKCDPHVDGLMTEAVAAGLPDIAVSADVGRLLLLLTTMTRGELAIELGTLAGYSAIWLARGLKSTGRLISVEPEETYAAFGNGTNRLPWISFPLRHSESSIPPPVFSRATWYTVQKR